MYFEAHIIHKNGTHWCGHTGDTPEKALDNARRAYKENLDFGMPQEEEEGIEIELFSCSLIATAPITKP